MAFLCVGNTGKNLNSSRTVGDELFPQATGEKLIDINQAHSQEGTLGAEAPLLKVKRSTILLE